MIQQLNHQNESVAKTIQQIQRSAYLIEAEMMQFHGIPQLKESVFEIQASKEIFLGYTEENRLLGFLSFKNENMIIDIHRLAVDPGHFRKGIGGKLFQFTLENFKGMNFIVSTGKMNEPAKNLYKSYGFKEMEDFEVAPGIYCTHLEKRVE